MCANKFIFYLGCGFFCQCKPCYQGNTCETMINACASNPCLNGGNCIRLRQTCSYQCSCSCSYSGPNCATPVTFCKLDSCQSNIFIETYTQFVWSSKFIYYSTRWRFMYRITEHVRSYMYVPTVYNWSNLSNESRWLCYSTMHERWHLRNYPRW